MRLIVTLNCMARAGVAVLETIHPSLPAPWYVWGWRWDETPPRMWKDQNCDESMRKQNKPLSVGCVFEGLMSDMQAHMQICPFGSVVAYPNNSTYTIALIGCSNILAPQRQLVSA